MWSSIQVLPNQVSKKFFYTFEDNDLPLEKIDQNHTKTICFKCDDIVMVFGEKPSLFIKTM